MRRGEIALWHRGTIVWQGRVSATIKGVDFDAVSMNIEDGKRFTKLTSRKAVDAGSVVAALELTGLEEADGAPAAGRTKIYLSDKRPIYLNRVQAISSIAGYASRF